MHKFANAPVRSRRLLLLALGCITPLLAHAADAALRNPAPTRADWAALADLPDLSGVWAPGPLDKYVPGGPEAPQWLPAVARQVDHLKQLDAEGRPQNIYINCLPEGLPSSVTQNLNSVEFKAVGIPTGGDTVIHERIHLIEPDTLADDLVIEAPHILTHPWETRRLFHRTRKRSFEIVEGVCRQGDFEPTTDTWGNPTYTLTRQQDGNVLPPSDQPKSGQPASDRPAPNP